MQRKRISGFILFCSVMFWITTAASDSNRAVRVIDDLRHGSGKVGSYQALIIAINDYKDDQIPDLETPLNDARAMAKLLQKKYGFAVETILGKEATKRKIYQALRRLSSKAKPDDSILIYYAGHGDLDRHYKSGWWIPYDAAAGDSYTYLDNVEVQNAMRSMEARHVLLISDSCYSGTLFGRTRAMPPVIDNKYYLNLYNEKSRWGMTSGNKTPVADSGTNGHSVFAYQLIKELRNNERPYLSTMELFTHIAPIVSNNSEQEPKCRPIRNTGDMGGEFVFLASSGAQVSAPGKTAISLEANVNGAKVFVDGRPVGITPLKDFSLSPGEHIISVDQEGFEAYTKRVQVEKGRTLSLYVYLDESGPAKARLFVETVPKDARIRILNIELVFQQGMALSPGRYHVEISAEGYNAKKLWVTLEAGEDQRLDIRLKAQAVGATGPTPPVTTVQAKKRKISNSLGMDFVYIEPDTFIMGSPPDESKRGKDEKQHRVTLTKGYYMQTTEVTQGQWKAVMGSNPSRFSNCHDCPVEKVSWVDIQKFISKLNRKEGRNSYRLPTEAEWEYAARAGTGTPFSFGDCLSTNQANFDGNHPMPGCSKGRFRKKPLSVGSFPANAWGLYDMHGNVWEWCQDWYGDYPSGAVTDPKGSSSVLNRVIRGGGWRSGAGGCRSTRRGMQEPGHRGSRLGFRLARSPE
jgi:formylglycine-generating enzyme required for sulfatase activity